MWRRHLSFAAALLSVLGAVPVASQCASSDRSSGQPVGYDAVQVMLPSNMPTTMKDAFLAGMSAWNASSCNPGGTSFPKLQTESNGAGRSVTVTYNQGTNPVNPASCSNFSGNEIRLYSEARVKINGVSQTVSCDRADIMQDNATHELGHLLGLDDQYSSGCSTYAMGQTTFDSSNGRYIDRTLHGAECTLVREVNETPREETLGLCQVDPYQPLCRNLECYNYGCQSPVVLDLGDDGFTFTGLEDTVLFDIDADQRPDRIAWTSAQGSDSFLVWDRNHNGRIDDGSELFGNNTRLLNGETAPNGFNVLFELELVFGNGNGFIEASDPTYYELGLWADANHNGLSEPNELQSLARAGVVGLAVEFFVSFETDAHGNQLKYQSTAYRRLGSERIQQLRTVDVFFRLRR